MNTKLLQKVKAAILAEPRQFDMKHWFGYDLSKNIPNCGTQGCIAGWTVALAENKNLLEAARIFRENFKTLSDNQADSILNINVREKAGKFLELTESQLTNLFYLDCWPFEFMCEYNITNSEEEHAQITAKRIDFFIETNGTDISHPCE